MRTTTILAIGLLAAALTPLPAADVTLEWDRNIEPEVAGYRLYFGTAAGIYTGNQSAGNATELTLRELPGGATYYFAVTAFTAEGMESPKSNEVVWTAPTTPLTLAQAGTLLTWTDSRPAPPAPGILTYRVEWAGLEGTFANGTTTAALTMAIPSLAPGPYTFRVVPLHPDGSRGEPSNAIQMVLPAAPPRLRIKVALQVSTDLEDWRTVFTTEREEERLFARTVMTRE